MKKLRFRKIGMVFVALLAVVAIFASVCLTACSDDTGSTDSASSVDQEEQNSSAPDYGNDESPSDSQKGEGESSSDDRTSDGDISSSGDEREEDESASPAAQLLVYQGMVISSAVAKTSTYSADNVAGDLVGKEDWIDDDRPFGDDSATLEQTLEQEFKVVGGGEDIYYADLNEDIYITVKFYNPSNYEILSFVLNGKTYASYMFESGSDMENIIIKLNVGSVAGINEYEISEIKYVDGSEIKYATMNGEAYVRCGVRGDEGVRASVSDERVGLDSISFTARVVDVYSLVEESDGFVKAVLYDGTDILDMVDLEVGNNEVEFEGLYPNTLYQYAIVAEYDDLSGNGMSLFYLYKNTVYTEALVLFNDVEVTKTSVSFGFEWYEGYDDSYLHTKFTFEGGSRLFEEVDPTSREITGLLSDHEYTLNVAYTGIYGETEAIRLTFKTLAMEVPEVELSITEIKQDSISYAIAVTDEDETGEISSVALYRKNKQVATSDEQEGTFDNLLSDNEYTLTIVYGYDLNDGNGSHTMEVSESVTTLAKAAPEAKIKISDVTQDGFSYEIAIGDEDAVGALDSITLSLNGTVVETGSALTGSFDGLLSGNVYTLTAVYAYDLNDGNGAQTLEISESVTILAKAAPEAKIEIDDVTQDGFSYEISVIDEDAVGSLESIVLSLEGEEVETFTDLTGHIDSLLSDKEYTLTVVYSYDLNDGAGIQTLEISKTAATLAKAVPEVGIEIKDVTQDGFSYAIILWDEDAVGSLDSITLFLNGTVVEIATALTGSFDSLLSDNEYTLAVVCAYDLNDGQGKRTLSLEQSISTLAKVAPEVEIGSIEAGKKDVSFNLLVTDIDETGESVSVTLSKNGDEIGNTTESSGTFDNLFSGVEYTLTVIYVYDLNDGRGERELVLTRDVATQAMVAPTVEISTTNATSDSLTFLVTFTDEDAIGTMTNIGLYAGDELASEDTSTYTGEMTYEGLSSYTSYAIVISYRYDLNDGEGERYGVVELVARTNPRMGFESIKVLNTTDVMEGEEITIRITMDNPNGVKFTSAVINGESYNVSTISTSTNLYIDILDYGQFDGGDTEFAVTQIVGVLDGVEYTIDVEGENCATVFVNGELSIVGFSLVTEAGDNGEERLYRFKSESLYYKIELNNPTGYDVIGVTVGGSTPSAPGIVVSDDKQILYISMPSDSKTGMHTVSLTAIYYGNDMIGERVKTYDMSVTYAYLSTDSSGIVDISTPEELMNGLTGWKYYRLANDIDLDGYNWINLDNSLEGVFDGNGYTICNLMGVTTYEDRDLYLGLFYYVEGVVMNLEICDVLYIVTLTSGSVSSAYDVYAGTVASTSGQMVLSHVYIDSSFQITNETGGTVYIGALSGSGSSGTNLYFVTGKLIGKVTSSKYGSNGCFGKGTISSSNLVDTRCECSLTILTSTSSTLENAEEYIQDGEYLFSVFNGAYTLENYLGKDKSITLPSSIDGHSYKIGDRAFSGSSITSIVVSEGVTEIGYNAFCNCTSLVSVSLPNSLTAIDEQAFYSCSALTTINIPKNVTYIGTAAFYNCTSLTEIYYNATYATGSSSILPFNKAGTRGNSLIVIVGANVLTIPGEMFYGSNVTSVIFEDGSNCTSISSSAFGNCYPLTTVMLPDSLTSIGSNAFSNCTSLTSVYYMGSADDWNKISIRSSAFPSNATYMLYVYSDEPYEIEGAGLWHYDENGNIVIWD